MGTLDSPTKPTVNTNEVLSPYRDHNIKVLLKEPMEVEQAVRGIQSFLMIPTPKYKEGKEPKYNDQNVIVEPGVEQDILYQFDIKHKAEFDVHARVIDSAMAVVPRVMTEYWRQLKIHKQTGAPPNIPVLPNLQPPPEPKKNILDRINPFKKFTSEEDETDWEIKQLLRQTGVLQKKWMLFKEWYYGSIKNPESKLISYSDIYSRSGMEILLNELRVFFDYWIVSLFMMTHKYAMDLEFYRIKDDTNKYVQAHAKIQSEQEKLHPELG